MNIINNVNKWWGIVVLAFMRKKHCFRDNFFLINDTP